jgi:transposase
MTVLPTIPRWGTDAGAMSEHSKGEVPARAKRRTFTGAYKLKVLAEYEAAAPGKRGAVLRREGLYSSVLGEFAQSAVDAVSDAGRHFAGLHQVVVATW